MIVALVDNGSLEAAAHRNLRAAAEALSAQAGVTVHAVSWKHSDRIPPEALDDTQAQAWTLGPFVRAMFALGQREFVFVPFFISPQGAIGSALHGDLLKLRAEIGEFEFTFSEGLAARGALGRIVAQRIRETTAARSLARPAIVVVDHGGPSAASAALRDRIATETSDLLGLAAGEVSAASMEGRHGPLLADHLRSPALAGRDVLIAMLFLSPGRHAGPEGDVARIARAAHPRTYFTKLVGDHPLAVEALAEALREVLATSTSRLRAFA